MSRNRKYFPHDGVLFVTTRAEEDLPIVCSYILNFIIWGILAKARSMYRVKICHFLFMSNHLHMMIVVDCPQDVSSFMGYIKCEISHAINRLLGRRQKTIWQDGYDSPLLLTANDIKRYIKYIYQNPSNAQLVHFIDEYPGVSSWAMFKTKKLVKTCPKLNRDLIPTLYSPALGVNEQKKIISDFENFKLERYNFILEPDAWRESFSESMLFTNEEIIEEIKKEEELQRIDRIKLGKDVIGSTVLRRESMTKEYVPKKYSKRMICICSNINLRKLFIGTYQYLSSLAKKAYQYWKRGDYSLAIPPSMFSPRRPDFASALSIY